MCIVNRQYIDNCDGNLNMVRAYRKQVERCKLDRKGDQGKAKQQDKTIVQLTKAGEAKDKKIAHLESRWSRMRLVGVGVAAGSCTAFVVSMFGETDGWARLVSGAGCAVGVGLAWKW